MDKIAIIGLACLFPDAQNPEEFWHNLMGGEDSSSLATGEEIGVDPSLFYDQQKGKEDKTYSLKGGYIRNFKFDGTGYNLPSEVIESLDPLFKGTLYVAKQALQNSKYFGDEKALENCGVILGNLSFPTKYSNQLLSPIYQQAIEQPVKELLQHESFKLAQGQNSGEVSPYNAMTSGMPSAIVAQALALQGINFSLDAACSSSLYAVDLACNYLRSQKTDLMLAGAISYADPLFIRMLFSGVHAYPDNGISHPLDKSSKGLTPADGVGMLVLKRYSDAVRDGDQIYATICGAGLSNDGRGRHLLSPNQQGQTLAFERAYTEAQINPQTIDYLECHATGTLLGDGTELASIDSFFGQHQASPLVGSAKSNVGHLLTAAGMVGMIKIILGMSKGVIPPTINLSEPLSSPNQVVAAEKIVQSPTPWPNNGSAKRAAVNAFGFGGTNAHLILEQPSSSEQIPDGWTEESKPIKAEKMAIVGMDAFFGECDGLDAFDRSIYEGKQHFVPLPPQRWKGIEEQKQLLQDYGLAEGKAPLGAYIQDFELDALRCKIPPNEVEKLNPQQLLTLKVADRALQDAGIAEGGNVAVIIAMETDPTIHQLQQRWNLPWQVEKGLAQDKLSLAPEQLSELENIVKDSLHHPAGTSEFVGYVGNIIASRISALWNFNGPALTLSAGENSTFKALEVAQLLISAGKVDAVVIGAVDLAGGPENILLRNRLANINTGIPTLGFDENSNGWLPGEGAGAVVIKALETAKQDKNRIYAAIDAISLVQAEGASSFPSQPQPEAVAQACQEAYQLAGIESKEINYLEVFGSGISWQDEAEIKGLIQAYRNADPDLSCAIGSVKSNIGHTYVASGMASLIKTALCLFHRYIPPVPQWSAPKMPEVWQGSPFYVQTMAKLWCLPSDTNKRVAAINGLGVDGTCAHLILSEELSQTKRESSYLRQTPFYLFPLAADNQEGLLEQLGALQQTVEDCTSLANVASQTFATFEKRTQATYRLAILGKDKKALTREFERAFKGVPKAFEQGNDWQTPGGSYFTAKPLGKKGKIAFVYPGAFNAYLGVALNLFRLFPQLFDDSFAQSVARPLTRLERIFCPRSLRKLSKRELEVLEQELLDNALGMLETGVGVSGMLTTIMKDYFQVKADCVFGYSLGEISMIGAQGVWTNDFKNEHTLNSSSLFGSRISGTKDAVREHWGIATEQDSQGKDFWSTYVLMAPAEQVRECVEKENRLYLTHINTPTEVVIAGEKEACQRVMETLKCDGFSLPLDHVLHCEAMRSEYDEIVKINTFPIETVPETAFYSAANYEPIKLESEAIGHNVAKALCQELDFPRLVNRVYEEGSRIFIEAGAGGTCSRWIDANLKGKEHLTISLDKRGADEHGTLVRALARLLCHGASVDLSLLYCPVAETSQPSKSIMKKITLGGSRISETILSERNKKVFQDVSLIPLLETAESPQLNNELPSTATSNSNGTKTELPPENSRDLRNINSDFGNSYQPAENLESYSSIPAFQENNQSNLNAEEDIKEMAFITTLDSHHYHKLKEKNYRVTAAHAAFLVARQESLKQMSEIINLQLVFSQKLLEQETSVSE
ncbi:MAG: beta-ketoacyl synthase N-terminal-like domain-containing protein [Coleofasciculaceae cyanobacterium]